MAEIPGDRQLHLDIAVSRPDGETWESIAPWVTRCEIELGNVDAVGTGNAGTDGVVRTMTFSLINDGALNPYWADDEQGTDTDLLGTDNTSIGLEDDSGTVWINLLFNTDHKYFRNSFHPRDQRSDWNWFDLGAGEVYSPLLYPNREVAVYLAITTPGVAPDPIVRDGSGNITDFGDYTELFYGYMGR